MCVTLYTTDPNFEIRVRANNTCCGLMNITTTTLLYIWSWIQLPYCPQIISIFRCIVIGWRRIIWYSRAIRSDWIARIARTVRCERWYWWRRTNRKSYYCYGIWLPLRVSVVYNKYCPLLADWVAQCRKSRNPGVFKVSWYLLYL